jgi:hypothetical protein
MKKNNNELKSRRLGNVEYSRWFQAIGFIYPPVIVDRKWGKLAMWIYQLTLTPHIGYTKLPANWDEARNRPRL